MKDLTPLFAAVRAACSPTVWSQGVSLARADAVIGQRDDGDEIILRVATQGGLVSHAVVLYPDDAEWSCECISRDDACAHVAASIIALKQARQDGDALPRQRATAHTSGVAPTMTTSARDTPSGVGTIAYRFTRTPTGLSFARWVIPQKFELKSTLHALTSGKLNGPRCVVSHADMTVERALGTQLFGVLPRVTLRNVLAALIDHADVRLDDQPIQVGDAVVGMIAVVQEHPEGFSLTIEQDRSIQDVFANGAVRLGARLCPLVSLEALSNDIAPLRRGRVFRLDEVSDLVTVVIPKLQKHMVVDMGRVRLPAVSRGMRPRVLLEVAREEGQELNVLPLLVYGDPPAARLVGDRLQHLQGAMPMRDHAHEERLRKALAESLGLVIGQRSLFRGEEALRMALRIQEWERMQNTQHAVTGDGHRSYYLAKALQPRVHVGIANATHTVNGDDDNATFDVGFFADAPTHGTASANAADVLRAWRDGASLVPLNDGGWAPLPHDWLQRYGQHIADLLAAKAMQDEPRTNASGTLPAYAMPQLAALCDDLGVEMPAAVARLRSVLMGATETHTTANNTLHLPDDLTATLRDYQRTGVRWLQLLQRAGVGALLADDMGLGKTLQTLCAVRGKTLVVAPSSVMHNWRNEATRFRPSLRCALYHGTKRMLDQDADITITTYALLRLDAATLGTVAWDTVVLDEAHTIKNPDSQVARAAYGLRAQWRIALTGTPVENRLDELWSQLHFTNPGLLGSRRDFQERYGKPIENGNTQMQVQLATRIKPFVLRRHKRDVAPELPPRTDVVLRCELSTRERQIYDAVQAATRKDVLEQLQQGGNILAALEALLRLRQACCDPALIPGHHETADRRPHDVLADDVDGDNTIAALSRHNTSSKIALLRDTLEEVVSEGHKALVFSQWTSLLDRVEPALQNAGIGFARLDGSMHADARAAVVAHFQQDAGPPVLLISLKAGGTGLNLTAADHVFLLDPWWNPAVEDQAADRTHRIGQTRPVIVHRLIAADTVEERILMLQDRKRDLAKAALGETHGDGTGIVTQSLGRDELLELLDLTSQD